MPEILRLIAFAVGLSLISYTLFSAIRTFVLPRSARDLLTGLVFRNMRRLFDLRTKKAQTYKERDEIMALFAPISLFILPLVWLVMVLFGYMAMFWALGVEGWQAAFTVSGSCLLTLGFATVSGLPQTMLAFSEAAIGLLVVALLIAYLPTMYSCFQKREAAVSMLEVRAGSPPSAVEMLKRFHRIEHFEKLNALWENWEIWFVDLEESHTSLAPLSFFRSPHPEHSWVTAAGTVLDAAALANSVLDRPRDGQAALCLRAGFLSLRRIADSFNIDYNPNPQPDDPISIARQEFEIACDDLAATGLALIADRDQAWLDFSGWRVNYDTVLLALAAITMAPEAPWSSDRSLLRPRRSYFKSRKSRQSDTPPALPLQKKK